MCLLTNEDSCWFVHVFQLELSLDGLRRNWSRLCVEFHETGTGIKVSEVQTRGVTVTGSK